MRAIVALGANLGNREVNLNTAVSVIEKRVGFVVKCSRWYETEPVNHPSSPTLLQPKFLNGVLVVDTVLTPQALLKELNYIEGVLGRRRDAELYRWGPRRLDLDIIACDDLVIAQEELIVPHPEMHWRGFVLEPLRDIWPDWRHPLLKLTAEELLLAVEESQGKRSVG